MPLQQHAPGGHYSGHNRIPTVNQFIQKLDKDKADRDKQIDQDSKAKATARQAGGDVQPHQEQLRPAANQKTVTDPTTGKEVIIEDVNQDMVNSAFNSVVCDQAPTMLSLPT